jgi:hypothetical protein
MDSNQTVKLISIIGSVVILLVVFFFLGTSNLFSEDYFIWAIVILGVGISVFSLVYSAWARRKRREAIEQLANEMGYSFTPEDKAFDAQIKTGSPFEILSKGRSRKAYNLVQGQKRDAQVALFDYQYTTGNGRSSQTHRQTLVLLTLEQAELVPFTLRGRGFFDKVAARFGQKEINIDTAPDFSKQHLVKGGDEEAVQRVFTPSVVALFEQQKNLACEVVENQLLFYRPERTVKPEELRSFMDTATQLLELLRRPTYDFDYAR